MVVVELATFNSLSKDWTSDAVEARLLYSTSTLDFAKRVCFLDHQDIRFDARNNTLILDVDMRSSSEPQSAS